VNGFSVLRFSPNPEELEHINVALVMAGPPPRIEFLHDFPKLACIAPDFDRSLLEDYLADLPQKIEGAGDLVFAIESLSSQFRVTPLQQLRRYAGEETVEKLKARYLARPRIKRARVSRDTVVPTKVNLYAKDILGIDERHMMKRVHPHHVLSERVLRRLRGDDFQVARAVDGADYLVLLDGVDVTKSPKAVRQRALAIDYAYYRMGGLREVIAEEENRQLALATITFGDTDEPHARWALETAQAHADFTPYDRESDLGLERIAKEAATNLADGW